MDLRSGKHAMATADDASGATVNGVPGLTDEPHELASSAQENTFALASMAAKVDLGMMIFLAAVVSITTPTDPDNEEHTIAIVAAATASALIVSPKGLFAKLLDAAVGWGNEPQTYENQEPADRIVDSARALKAPQDKLSEKIEPPPIAHSPHPIREPTRHRTRGPELKDMPDFSASSAWPFFETVETLYTRSGIQNTLYTHTTGYVEGVAYSTLKLTLVGGMKTLGAQHKTTKALWAAMKERLQPTSASNQYVLRQAISAIKPPTTGSTYDNLLTYFEKYDEAEAQAVAICGPSFAVDTAARLHHYQTAIPQQLMESQSILLMAITGPHKLWETLLTATRPLVHGAAIGAIASLAS